jgi:molybdopterin synthase catalytic subunit
MDSRVVLAEISSGPVEPGSLLELVWRPSAGATSLFVGQVRDHDPQAAGTVVSLDYTCHPSATRVIGEILADVLLQADPAGQARVAAVHRVGHLDVGDPAFVVAVSAPHRDLAFRLCEEVVERAKQELPIWKQQFEADGSHRWSNLA